MRIRWCTSCGAEGGTAGRVGNSIEASVKRRRAAPSGGVRDGQRIFASTGYGDVRGAEIDAAIVYDADGRGVHAGARVECEVQALSRLTVCNCHRVTRFGRSTTLRPPQASEIDRRGLATPGLRALRGHPRFDGGSDTRPPLPAVGTGRLSRSTVAVCPELLKARTCALGTARPSRVTAPARKLGRSVGLGNG